MSFQRIERFSPEVKEQFITCAFSHKLFPIIALLWADDSGRIDARLTPLTDGYMIMGVQRLSVVGAIKYRMNEIIVNHHDRCVCACPDKRHCFLIFDIQEMEHEFNGLQKEDALSYAEIDSIVRRNLKYFQRETCPVFNYNKSQSEYDCHLINDDGIEEKGLFENLEIFNGDWCEHLEKENGGDIENTECSQEFIQSVSCFTHQEVILRNESGDLRLNENKLRIFGDELIDDINVVTQDETYDVLDWSKLELVPRSDNKKGHDCICCGVKLVERENCSRTQYKKKEGYAKCLACVKPPLLAQVKVCAFSYILESSALRRIKNHDFISIDFEVDQKDRSIVLEMGLTYFRSGGSQVHSEHYVNSDLINSNSGKFNQTGNFRFGLSQIVKIDKFKDRIFEFLRLGYTFIACDSRLEQSIFSQWGFTAQILDVQLLDCNFVEHRRSLENYCDDFGIPNLNLHNAGNDARVVAEIFSNFAYDIIGFKHNINFDEIWLKSLSDECLVENFVLSFHEENDFKINCIKNFCCHFINSGVYKIHTLNLIKMFQKNCVIVN